MDIIFVNPPLTLKERFGKFAPAGNIMPPLGLCYLAAACRAHGLKAEIIDAPAEGLDTAKVKERILQRRPRFLGLTATTLSILNASRVAQAVKHEANDILTVIGGPHLSSAPQRTMERHPFFDFGVIGEGESTIIELIDSVQGNLDIEGVNGIIYHSPGGLRRTEIRENIKDLDALPLPAFDIRKVGPDLVLQFYHRRGQQGDLGINEGSRLLEDRLRDRKRQPGNTKTDE